MDTTYIINLSDDGNFGTVFTVCNGKIPSAKTLPQKDIKLLKAILNNETKGEDNE